MRSADPKLRQDNSQFLLLNINILSRFNDKNNCINHSFPRASGSLCNLLLSTEQLAHGFRHVKQNDLKKTFYEPPEYQNEE